MPPTEPSPSPELSSSVPAEDAAIAAAAADPASAKFIKKRIKKMHSELDRLQAVLEPAEEPDEATPTERRKPPVLLTLALAAGLAVGLFYDVLGNTTVTTPNAQVTGSIVTAGARTGGRLAELLVEVGQEVEAGQVIAVIDPADLQALVRQAEANLAIARAGLKPTRSDVTMTGATASLGVAQADAARQAALADLATARIQVNAARDEVRRLEPLQQSGFVSSQALDVAKVNIRIAEANVVAAVARVSAAEEAHKAARTNTAVVVAKQGGVEAAEALVKRAEAELAAARLRLAQSQVTAPTDGIVARRLAHPGEVIALGQGLVAIVESRKLWVTAYVDETQIPRVRSGAKVEVRLDAFPHRPLAAHVAVVNAATGDSLSLAPSNTLPGTSTRVVQRVPVTITLDTPEPSLKPGMSASVRIDAIR